MWLLYNRAMLFLLRLRTLRVASVLLLLPAFSLLTALGAQAASLHITEAQWQSVDAPGFSTPPLTLNPKSLPDNWQTVSLPHALPIDLLHQATAGAPLRSTRTTWFKVSLPDLKALPGPLALYGARIKTDGTVAVYIDGHLVHRTQPLGLHWSSSREPLWVLLEDEAHDAPPHEILLRLEHSRASQVALSSLWLGPADSLSWRYRWRQWFQLELPSVFNAAFMAVGVFSLLVWFRRRKETAYLLFFAVALACVSRGLHFSADFPVAKDWFGWLTANSLFWMITVVHISIEQLHGRPNTWLTRTLLGFCVLVGVLTLPMLATLPITPRVTPLLYLLAPLMSATVGIVGGLSAWRHSREAMLVSIGIGICTAFGMVDWLLQNNFISPEGWYLGVYNNAITFGIFGYLMYRRYMGAITDVEHVNSQLEQRLQTREAELADSYERLRAAEQRQTLSQERQRLTQDMHDGLGSSLVSALRVVEAGRLSEADVAQVLKSCIDDLKLTIDSMEPVEADLLLLLATLRFRLGPRLASAGITLRWEVVDVPALDWLDPRNALHILRILQEAFANILKHTEASEIRVSTSAENGGVSVTIADNGQGFSHEEALQNGGKGLKNQLRRAQSIGGKVRWESPGRGSRMILWVPEKRRLA
jgi:signal transduction histidine kinase